MQSRSPCGTLFYASSTVHRRSEPPHPIIIHGTTGSSKGGGLWPGILWVLARANFKARFLHRLACRHRALLPRCSTPSRLSNSGKNHPLVDYPWCYIVFWRGSLGPGILEGLVDSDIKARFRQGLNCHHSAIWRPRSIPSQLSNTIKNGPISQVSMVLQWLRKGEVLGQCFFDQSALLLSSQH